MAFGNPATQRVVDSTRDSFFDFIDKRMERFPTVLERMAANPFGATWLLRPFAWIPFTRHGLGGRKFIFLSDRFPDLVRAMADDNATIVGSRSELRRSKKLGIGFCFNADLFLASHAILFGTRGVPVERIVERWIQFLGRQADPCYLILPHDTSPISLLLARISAECPNMKSVCIQHGLFNAGSDGDDIEGRNSDINLVYDESQKAEMLRRLPGANVQVMGFPAEISVVKQGQAKRPDVILVGTGYTDQPFLLQKSFEIYRDVASILVDVVGRIEYRPHPSEQRAAHPGPSGLAVSTESKHLILSGTRRLFIGFNSTLLYEASLAGHLVVILDHEILPGYAIQPIGVTVHCRQLAELPRIVSEMGNSNQVDPASNGALRARILNAINRAVDL